MACIAEVAVMLAEDRGLGPAALLGIQLISSLPQVTPTSVMTQTDMFFYYYYFMFTTNHRRVGITVAFSSRHTLIYFYCCTQLCYIPGAWTTMLEKVTVNTG